MSAILELKDVETAFGNTIIHRGVSFSLEPGTVTALIGGSGSGKTTLLRAILGLLTPTKGEVRLFGESLRGKSEREAQALRNRYGILFQNGALFSALTVGENIAVPLREQTHFSDAVIEQLVSLRLALVGLAPETAVKMPSELSGGMRKRVALARALALEPELLFLDEPTSGLDPINARAFDHLIRTLTDSLGLTVVMITHDLDSLLGMTDRILVLDQGKIIADGPVEEVRKVAHPWIQEYFSARAA